MPKRIKQIVKTNEEILEKFFRDAQRIIYSRRSPHQQGRALHAAKYYADYYMRINNYLIKQHLQEKPSKTSAGQHITNQNQRK